MTGAPPTAGNPGLKLIWYRPVPVREQVNPVPSDSTPVEVTLPRIIRRFSGLPGAKYSPSGPMRTSPRTSSFEAGAAVPTPTLPPESTRSFSPLAHRTMSPLERAFAIVMAGLPGEP